MADLADQAGSNDFNEEKVNLQRTRVKEEVVQRGFCLFCKAAIPSPKINKDGTVPPTPLYCDPDESDCREEHERRQLLARKTGRMLHGY